MVPCMALGVVAILPCMVAIPYVFRQNEPPGNLTVLVLGCIAACTTLDAVNNRSVLPGNQNLLFWVRTVFGTTTTVTGTVAGTTESSCRSISYKTINTPPVYYWP